MHSSRKLQLEQATFMACEFTWMAIGSRACTAGAAASTSFGVEAGEGLWCAVDMHQIMAQLHLGFYCA